MTSFDYLQQRQQSLRESQRFRTLIPREREGVYLVESNAAAFWISGQTII